MSRAAPYPRLLIDDFIVLLREIRARLKESPDTGDVNDIWDILPLIGRSWEFFPKDASTPVRIIYEDPNTNPALFEALSQDIPGRDWRRIFGIVVQDPAIRDKSGPFWFWAQDVNNKGEPVGLSDRDRRRLIVAIARLIRWLKACADARTDGTQEGDPPAWIPSEPQRQALEHLKGKALTRDSLASKLDKDPRVVTRDVLKALREQGLIRHDRRAGGFYRPDAPPPDVEPWLK
jgi:hypothetical protein